MAQLVVLVWLYLKDLLLHALCLILTVTVSMNWLLAGMALILVEQTLVLDGYCFLLQVVLLPPNKNFQIPMDLATHYLRVGRVSTMLLISEISTAMVLLIWAWAVGAMAVPTRASPM